ncbi:MAG: helix-turn-helix domain-containing protein [Acidobacteriota bacterium]
MAYRRRAIRLTIKGKSASEILEQIPRSRAWLHKWQQRFEQIGWAGLESSSRRPHNSPQQYNKETRTLVLNLRRKFVRSKIGLIGARAIEQFFGCNSQIDADECGLVRGSTFLGKETLAL